MNHPLRRVSFLSYHTSPLAIPGVSDAGGMNLYIRRIAHELGRRGIGVDIFTRRTDPRRHEVTLHGPGVRVIHLRAGPERPVAKAALFPFVPEFASELVRFVRQHRVQYDVMHSHYWLSGAAGIEVASALDVPLIQTFHTLARVKELYLGEPDPSDTFCRAREEQRIIESADAIVGATPDELHLIERLYCRHPAHFVVIPPGVDFSVFRPLDRAACRRALGLESEKIVLFVGRIDRIKGLDTLLRAIAEIGRSDSKTLTLLIVGGARRGDDPEVARYRTMATRLGIESAVTFVGHVPTSKLPMFYSAADVCAVPSAYESFGMAAAESMACGTPVVGYRVGGLAHTVSDGETGFLAAPGNSKDFTAKLRRALQADGLAEMGARARLGVQRYTWGAAAERTLALYQQIHCSAICSPCHAAGQH